MSMVRRVVRTVVNLPTLRSLLPSLAAADRRIADVVLAHPETIIFLSISELAEQTGTAKSTIVRAR